MTTPIEVRGRYLWRGNERFLVKGVIYQQRSHDPHVLSESRLHDLGRDIELFHELGINTVSVYGTDSFQDPSEIDAAMKLLAEAYIYVIMALSSPRCSINRMDPVSSYTASLLRNYRARLGALAVHSNTLGVFVGAEIINEVQSTPAAATIRAAVRDLKAYMADMAASSGQRVLPVGYSASDVQALVAPTYGYLASGLEEEAIDFFGWNEYSWADPSSFEISGYMHLMEYFRNTPIPLIFSEYGARLYRTRPFTEVACIYSENMTGILSGGLAYEFFLNQNLYGLVRIVDEEGQRPDTLPRAEKLRDFRNLREQLARVRERPAMTYGEWADSESTAGMRPAMPELSDTWQAGTELPPTPLL